jgi:AcrR family transcriptional regulator
MLDVAERLFAEHGIAGVPLQSIVLQSAQRNRSALNYHFGSLAGLVGRLLNRRLAHINHRRHALLDGVEQAGQQADARALVAATFQALVDAVRDTPWGADYVQVLAQVTYNPALSNKTQVDADNLSSVLRARRLLHAALPRLPAQQLDQRIVWFADSMIYAVTRWVRELGPKGISAAHVEGLVDYCHGALVAPAKAPGSVGSVPVEQRQGLWLRFDDLPDADATTRDPSPPG